MSRLRLKIEINKILNDLNISKNSNCICPVFKILKARYPYMDNLELSYMIKREIA
ncbi:hypothetical protein [Arcobacter sp. FWKO B]|uniref:hypothetical protein n=1 Tax=Arcobacter sp. FWKO B TaxID=2593672 RepID=UPI001904162B|nr:hypothetical protein [Arcobacter sp. FWKO B]